MQATTTHYPKNATNIRGWVHRRERINRGYSLVEVVVATLILGLVLIGALNVLAASVRTNLVANLKLNEPSLAHQMLAEVLALPYEDPESPGGPLAAETGETSTNRAGFDDVDDYTGWSHNPPIDKNGVEIPNSSAWTRTVQVQYFNPTSGQVSATDTGLKLISVVIIAPDGDQYMLNALRSRWGSLEQPPSADMTVVTSIDAQLQLGSQTQTAVSAASLQNHATDE